jgi:hypothetical protein
MESSRLIPKPNHLRENKTDLSLPPKNPLPYTWMKPTLAIAFITAVIQIISLQKRRAIFGGDSVWFTNVKYIVGPVPCHFPFVSHPL